MEDKTGLRLIGRVEWAGLPVPGAGIELKDTGNYYQLPALAATIAEASGEFVFENPPVGEYMVYAISPVDDYWQWSGHNVTIRSGQTADAGTLELFKKLELIEPVGFVEVNTPTPVLRWAHFPDAARYVVDIFDELTQAAVVRQETTAASLVVAPPLDVRGNYQWVVNAYDAAGHILAYDHGQFFTAPAAA